MTDFWDVAIIALMMDAESNYETSVSLYETTWRNIPEDSSLHTRCREKQKPHQEEKYYSNPSS
jgi:hypothetical protein